MSGFYSQRINSLQDEIQRLNGREHRIQSHDAGTCARCGQRFKGDQYRRTPEQGPWAGMKVHLGEECPVELVEAKEELLRLQARIARMEKLQEG